VSYTAAAVLFLDMSHNFHQLSVRDADCVIVHECAGVLQLICCICNSLHHRTVPVLHPMLPHQPSPSRYTYLGAGPEVGETGKL
jgi:hypothetical protein